MTFTTTKSETVEDTTYEVTSELLETGRDWLPYVVSTFGWIVALVAVIVR